MPIFVSLMKIISRISQNDFHILHNGHICQTYKIIRVNIELAILTFILPTLDHANFKCQQTVLRLQACLLGGRSGPRYPLQQHLLGLGAEAAPSRRGPRARQAGHTGLPRRVGARAMPRLLLYSLASYLDLGCV